MNPGHGIESLQIAYLEVKSDFVRWMTEKCSEEYVKQITSYLDKYLTHSITTPEQLMHILSTINKGKRHFIAGLRNLLNYYEIFHNVSPEKLAPYRKILKMPRTNLDNYVPDTEQILKVYECINDERYRLLFKLLVYSGLRLKEAVYLLNNYNNSRIIINGKIAKYPIPLNRETKRSYYAYMPKSFALTLKPMAPNEDAVKQYFSKRGLPAKYLRKWNYNFLILNGVPESVADFIQGRASITVGSMHYLAKVKQADEWYSRVVDLFPL